MELNETRGIIAVTSITPADTRRGLIIHGKRVALLQEENELWDTVFDSFNTQESLQEWLRWLILTRIHLIEYHRSIIEPKVEFTDLLQVIDSLNE